MIFPWILGMVRTKRVNRYCPDCGGRLVYYPRLSNPKAPNEFRILVYACPDCTKDFEVPKIISIKRTNESDPIEAVEIEIKENRSMLEAGGKPGRKARVQINNF